MATDPLLLAVDALAAARLTHLVVEDGIADRPRERIKSWSFRRPYGSPGSRVGELIECGWCSGVWVAAAVLLARRLAPRWWHPLALGLALAQVAGMLNDAQHVEVAEAEEATDD